MQLIERRPWFYGLICLFVGVPPAGAIYTFGDTIYAPGSKGRIAPDLWAHEKVHWHQQGRFPLLWWLRYLVDKKFRIQQEAEAYRAQVATWPRSQQEHQRHQCARILASPMYGGVSFKAALDAITYRNSDG